MKLGRRQKRILKRKLKRIAGDVVAVIVGAGMFELDGKQRIELDKINNVYKVNGVDLLAKIRKQC